VLFVIFLFWAYVPESFYGESGIKYFLPSRYWAIAIPTWLVVSLVLLETLYAASGMYFSHPRDSYLTMQDKGSVLVHPKEVEEQNENNDRRPSVVE
jgi:phosphatidylinositol glycan class P protein